jgi:uncharacterized protein YggE
MRRTNLFLSLFFCLLISTQCRLRQKEAVNQPVTLQPDKSADASKNAEADKPADQAEKVVQEAPETTDTAATLDDQKIENSNNSRVFGYIPIIKVTGKAVGSASTDIVKVQVEVLTKDMSATASLQQNNNNSQLAIAALNQMNIANGDIETSDFSLNPQYDYQYNSDSQRSESVFSGYQVSNKLRITTHDLTQAAQIIDAAIKSAKGININSVDFDINPDTRTKMEDSLIQSAVADARSKAEIALDGTGYRIKGIKSIDLDSTAAVPIDPVPMMEKTAAAQNAQVVLFGNKQDITMQADVVFYIEQFQ